MTTSGMKQQDLIFSLFKPIISQDQNRCLVQLPLLLEIWEMVKTLNSWKAREVDGMNAEFFKKSWNVIGEDITNLVQYFFRENSFPLSINEMLIVLIPIFYKWDTYCSHSHCDR